MACVNAMADGRYYSTVAPGTNRQLSTDDIERLTGLIRNAKVIIMQLEIPLNVIELAIDIASESGVYSILNAAPAHALPSSVLKKVDCLIVNEVEGAFYANREITSISEANEGVAELLKQRMKQTSIITLGKNGSVLCNADGCIHFAADKSIIAVETTGSGDSYISGFAYMKMLGYSDEIACEFACRLAEKTITRVGAQDSMPTLAEVMDVFKKVTEESK